MTASQKVRLGIDEAGRGSLIGPMIVAGVVLDEAGERALVERGVRDSKRLSPSKREELLGYIIEEAVFVEIIPIGPPSIDTFNLNALTRKAMRTIILDASSALNIEEVILDRVGKTFSYLKEIRGRRVRIVMEERADARYPVVSAASILAKVFRDWCIGHIRNRYGLRGSGYPSDHKTTEWLRAEFENIPAWLIRHKWKTLRNLGLSQMQRPGLDKFISTGGSLASEPPPRG